MSSTQDQELFELCKQVYEATGWWDVDHRFEPEGFTMFRKAASKKESDVLAREGRYPLYTSDYLLEKLPKQIKNQYRLTLAPALIDKWRAAYDDDYGLVWSSAYDTVPAEALALLALELKKEGLL